MEYSSLCICRLERKTHQEHFHVRGTLFCLHHVGSFALLYLENIVIFSKSWEAQSNMWATSWRYFALLTSISIQKSGNFAQAHWATWVTSFTLESWQFHNTPSTRFLTWRPQQLLPSYGFSWDFASSLDLFYKTSCKLQHQWTRSCRKINSRTSRSSPERIYSH